MAEHNKITFVKEYCKCRRIPCRFKGEQFIIGNPKEKFGSVTYFSAYTFSYSDLIREIDRFVEYDEYGYYKGTDLSGKEK